MFEQGERFPFIRARLFASVNIYPPMTYLTSKTADKFGLDCPRISAPDHVILIINYTWRLKTSSINGKPVNLQHIWGRLGRIVFFNIAFVFETELEFLGKMYKISIVLQMRRTA